MSAIRAAVIVAAAWRLTRLVVDDEITRELREAVSNRWPGSKAAHLVNCPYCVSVWAGAVAVAAPPAVAGALAASAGTLGVKWAAEVVEAWVSK